MPQAGIFSPELKLSNAALTLAAAGASLRGFRYAAAAGEAVFACSGDKPDGRRGLLIALDGDIQNLKEEAGKLYSAAVAGKKPEELLADIYRAQENFPAERLSGDFTFSIYDRAKRKLFLFRSGSGGRPLYYGFAGGSLAWASDIVLLRNLFGFKLELAPRSLDLYLALNYIPAPDTAYKNLSKLQMGEMLVSRAGKPAAVRLCNGPSHDTPPGLTFNAAKKAVNEKLQAAAANAAAAAPRCAFLLSGAWTPRLL